jgi:hypothetical protein
LRLKVATDSSKAVQTVEAVSDISWGENSINYDNRPVPGSSIASLTGSKANTWVEVDITSYVVANRGQLMSIGIEETSSDSMNIYTREAASNQPVLGISF